MTGTPTGAPTAAGRAGQSGQDRAARDRNRFPGFDPVDQASHWDAVTTGVVMSRLSIPPDVRFFTPAQEAIATALLDQLLGQDRPHPQDPRDPQDPQDPQDPRDPSAGGLVGTADDPPPEPAAEPLVSLVQMIDARLAEAQTDGWRYAGMPEDGQAWRDTLGYLDADATAKFSCGFAECPPADQQAIIQAVQDLGSGEWYGLNAARVWSLWTRYACTAFYAHPSAWAEIGFPGPAYPRGYKNAKVGGREPFEVADTAPADDPVRGTS